MPDDPATGGPASENDHVPGPGGPPTGTRPYREVTVMALLFALVIGAVMNAAITYAGLKIGFTIGGSAIAAVLGFGVLRGVILRAGIDPRDQHRADRGERGQHVQLGDHLHGPGAAAARDHAGVVGRGLLAHHDRVRRGAILGRRSSSRSASR
jgi:hypothetical protein